MALNLVRNSRVFFTTNVDSTSGVVATSGFTNTNTYEIQVLDGFSFSQNSNADTVTISEAGVAPVRGQRSFNTSLAPVDFSFSSYLRPDFASSVVTAEESVLWNALFGDKEISTANTITIGGTISGITYAYSAGVGTVTIAGTSLTTTGAALGDVLVIGGATGATALGLTYINAPAVLKTTSGTSITLELINSSTAAITGITGSAIKLYKSAWAPAGGSTFSLASTAASNKNQLLKFGMLFLVDQVTYAVDNCALTQLNIDFGLDAIATGAWTGQATNLRKLADGATATGGTFGGGTISGSYAVKNTAAGFITNKLSTVSLKLVNPLINSAGTTIAAAGTAYAVALTGGSITINNNINYVTPANLGVVNLPVTYYTGQRAISGTINAYLKTGAGVGSTGQLLADMLDTATATIEPMFALQIAIGGSGNNDKVVLDMPSVTLTLPAVDVQQVVSANINFTAQGSVPGASTSTYDLTQTNDLTVRYYSV
jgi:hypothetical protein